MTKQYDKEFKKNAVQYHYDHPELKIKECAASLGVPYDTYNGWLTAHKNKGENAFRGSGNYSSDEQKKIARLKRELRDTQDALEVLKNDRHSGKVTETTYEAVSELAEASERHVSV